MVNYEKARQMFNDKQLEVLEFYHKADFKILVNHGAIRSGKTHINNLLFLSELRRIGKYAADNGIVDPMYILAGADLGALSRNVMNPMTEKYGVGFKLNRFNMFKLFGVLVCCFGHDDIGKLNQVTGMTAYGAYVNEAVRARDEVLKQIIKRCSASPDIRGRIIMDTNPDGPQHPVKIDYIDKSGENGIHAFHWEITDNLQFLGQQYIDDVIATTPSGVYTDRDIRGLWVTPEGAIYRDFDKNEHLVDDLPKRYDGTLDFANYFCGVDWGYEHKGAILLFGETPSKEQYLIRIIAKQHKLIDWWKQEALNIKEEFGRNAQIPFYCDDARPDLIKEFRQAGLWTLSANKSVAAGIEEVARRFKTKTLKVLRSEADEFLKEIYTYVWNPNPRLAEPIKINDDIMDAMRYGVYTHKCKWR